MSSPMQMDYESVEFEPNRNAEAYRNYHPSVVPAQIEKCLDFIQFSSEGHLLLGSSNLTGRFWNGSLWYFVDPPDGKPDIETCLTGIECESGVPDGKFLNDEKKVIVGEDSGSIQILALTEEENTFRFTPVGLLFEHDKGITSIGVFKDKERAVSAGADCILKVWDLDTLATELTVRPAHTHIIMSVDVRPSDEGSVFASCSLDGTAALWDTRNPKPAIRVFEDWQLTAVAWQPSQTNVLSVGTGSGKIVFVDVRQPGEKLSEVSLFNRAVRQLRFAGKGLNYMAASADDVFVKVLDCTDLASPSVRYVDERHDDMVRSLAWHPKTNRLYSCGWDRRVLNHDTSAVTANMDVNES